MNLVQMLRTRTEPSTVRHSVATVDDYFTYMGSQYPFGFQTTMSGSKQEDIPNSFVGYSGAFKTNSVIFGLVLARMQVFSQARFTYRKISDRSTSNGSQTLRLLERPWPGGTSLDLLARSLLYADLAGNDYTTRVGTRLRKLRPDWTSIILGSDSDPDDPSGMLDAKVIGYAYKPGGKLSSKDVELLPADKVAHFAPMPDPEAEFRGMSWITPVIRELKADNAATDHKLKFFENAATPNLAVSLDASVTPDDFEKFVEQMDAGHRGWRNAYKTLYMAGGADVTVIGADLKQLDFKVTQGAGETRIALAAGVHPVVAGLSEGMQGSSLNAGNYQTAKRQFSDKTLQYLWRNMAASFETLVSPPPGSELWFDASEIPFLQDDLADTADIQQKQSAAIRQLVDGGFDPPSVVKAIQADDMSLLTHTGKLSVQLQDPSAGGVASADDIEAELEKKGIDPALINAAGILIRSGFDPNDAMDKLGLPPVQHLGLLPVTVQSPQKVAAEGQVAEAIIAEDDQDPASN